MHLACSYLAGPLPLAISLPCSAGKGQTPASLTALTAQRQTPGSPRATHTSPSSSPTPSLMQRFRGTAQPCVVLVFLSFSPLSED